MTSTLKRRYLSSSSSSFSDTPFYDGNVPGTISIEAHVASKDPFRVAPAGCIPIGCQYSCVVGIVSMSTATLYEQNLSKIKEVLTSRKISWQALGCYSIRQKYELASEGIDLILVSTHDENPRDWVLTAGEILNLFTGAGVASDALKVEIRNPERMNTDTSYILEDNAELLGGIALIKETISTAVKSQLPDTATSIAYHMRGKKGCSPAERRPTIMVDCKARSVHCFGDVENYITRSTTGLDLKVKIALEWWPSH